MSEDEIQGLVELAREGDSVAFTSLYDVFAPRVYRFFRFRVATAETAEDLTQRVFLKMVEQLPNYRSRGVPFAAWLFRVARNTWIDEHRTSHSAMPLESLVERTSDRGDPQELASAAFDWDRAREALDLLPADQREVIACRFLAGLSPRETGMQMGRSEGSVRVLQHRALAALRRRLQAGEGSSWSATGEKTR
jgi:RNA polymerase sigma-70 factor (ECF subfamily)